MDSSQHTPAVAAKGVLQFEFPIPVMDPGPAQENTGLHPHMLDLAHADHLPDMDPEQLPLLVLHLQPQGLDGAVGIAYGYDINRTTAAHDLHLPSFVCSIIAHSFDNSKGNFMIASLPRI